MRIANLLLFILLFFFTTTCQQNRGSDINPDDETDNPNSRLQTQPEEIRPELLLAGAFSSSAKVQTEISNLFDTDPQTHWESKLGTGPGESIGFTILGEGAWISKIHLTPKATENCARINRIDVLINGKLHTYGSPSDTIHLDTFVTNLIINFRDVEALREKKFELEQEKITIGVFPNNRHIGLERLLVLDSLGRAYHLKPPTQIGGRMATSSTLNPLAIYHAGHLFDFRPEFPWVEGGEGFGNGDSILFQFEREVCISKLLVWNGMQSSLREYEANARIKTLIFRPFEDTSSVFFLLPDAVTPTEILLNPKTSRNWLLKILESYPGKITRDLAIGELLLFDCNSRPFIIKSGLADQFQNEISTKAAKTILEGTLERYLHNEMQAEDGTYYTQKSIILHTNGVFCAFKQQYTPDTDITSINLVDGYWVIQEAAADFARLKLWGRWLNKGNFAENDKSVLGENFFEEELTLKAGFIEGGQVLGRFYTE